MVHLYISFITLLLIIFPAWKICKKAGFNPAISLWLFVPFLGIIPLIMLAFSDWPALKNEVK